MTAPTPRTDAAIAAVIDARGELGPEHRALVELCRELERLRDEQRAGRDLAALRAKCDRWYRFAADVGARTECLQSSFPDGNGHILRAIDALRAENERRGALLSRVVFEVARTITPELRRDIDAALDAARATDPTNATGPAGTYGCGCASRNALECAQQRMERRNYANIGPGERCECLCHKWAEDDGARAGEG